MGMVTPSPDQALWDVLLKKPTIPIPFVARSTDLLMVGPPCVLDGWQLRDTTGGGGIVEFFDGQDANGVIIGEASVGVAQGAQPINIDTDVDASSANAAAANNVTLPGVASQTTFITGFEITGNGATAAGDVTVTVTGILGGTKTYHLAIPLVAAPSNVSLLVEFTRPIPASAANTAIVVNVPSFGAGNTSAAVTAHGFQRQVQSGTIAAVNQVATGPGGLNYALCRNGLFMHIIQGTLRGTVWVKV